MVTNSFRFTVKYFELSYLRLLRGNLAPGQEGNARLLPECKSFFSCIRILQLCSFALFPLFWLGVCVCVCFVVFSLCFGLVGFFMCVVLFCLVRAGPCVFACHLFCCFLFSLLCFGWFRFGVCVCFVVFSLCFGLVGFFMCVVLFCCFLFSLLCFGWFRFGVGRQSTKIALFSSMASEKISLNYCYNMLLANENNTKNPLNT